MQKCPELSKLPKASAARSLNFKRQTPGCITRIAFSSSDPPLDPSHPATKIKRGSLPIFKSNALTVNAYPYALLGKPERIWTEPFDRPFETWQQRVERMVTASRSKHPTPSTLAPEDLHLQPVLLNNDRKGQVSMSFLTIASRNILGKTKRHIRVRLTRKLKTAVNYVVTRGARVEEADGQKVIMFSESSQPEENKWILRGWSYKFVPTMEIYLMPYQDLIPLVRSALLLIWKRGMALEAIWEKDAQTLTASNSREPPLITRENNQKEGDSKRRPSRIQTSSIQLDETPLSSSSPDEDTHSRHDGLSSSPKDSSVPIFDIQRTLDPHSRESRSLPQKRLELVGEMRELTRRWAMPGAMSSSTLDLSDEDAEQWLQEHVHNVEPIQQQQQDNATQVKHAEESKPDIREKVRQQLAEKTFMVLPRRKRRSTPRR